METPNIKFYGCDETHDSTLEMFCNDHGQIFIEIVDLENIPQWILLNKPTAVLLVKKLKLEISKVEEDK